MPADNKYFTDTTDTDHYKTQRYDSLAYAAGKQLKEIWRVYAPQSQQIAGSLQVIHYYYPDLQSKLPNKIERYSNLPRVNGLPQLEKTSNASFIYSDVNNPCSKNLWWSWIYAEFGVSSGNVNFDFPVIPDVSPAYLRYYLPAIPKLVSQYTENVYYALNGDSYTVHSRERMYQYNADSTVLCRYGET